MIIGTKEFVDTIRSKYMPDNFHKEIPQQRALGKSVDSEKVLEKTAGISMNPITPRGIGFWSSFLTDKLIVCIISLSVKA
ncbi:MAG: hypothetical protein JJV92_03935 [Desulfosarcina sp.]|nr:hypothetical protein [Desulfobacterales bacterium]